MPDPSDVAVGRSTPPESTPPVPASPPPATTRYWTFVRVPSCTVSEPGPGQLSTTSSPTSSRCAPSHVTVAPGGVPAFAKATGAPASRWQRLMPAPRGQRHGRGVHATRAHIRCPRPVVPARSCPPLISQHLLHQFQMSGMATLTRLVVTATVGTTDKRSTGSTRSGVGSVRIPITAPAELDAGQ